MAMFIWVYGPACLCCGAELEWQSKTLYLDGVKQPLSKQRQALRPGAAGEIHATCRSCGSHFELGIDRGLTGSEYQANRLYGAPRPYNPPERQGLGTARRGQARQGQARPGQARQGVVLQGKARHG